MNLMDRLPGYYRKSGFVKEMYHVIQDMFDLSDEEWDTAIKNLFPAKADDLSLSEKDVGIETDPSMETEIRRLNVLNRIRGNGILTVEKLKEIVEAFEPTGVRIIEKFQERIINLYFENCIGTPEHYTEMMNAIDEVKPAHIEIQCIMRLLIWDEASTYIGTWNDVKSKCKTWGGLLEYDYMKEN